MDTATLIIGGGLCGLTLADALERQGQDYLLVEARDRFGGRIASASHMGAQFDMGPAWVWPGQPRIAALVERLGLRAFPQYATGAQTFEDASGAIHRGRGMASAEGSWRIAGGVSALVSALESRLPVGAKRVNAKVTHLAQSDGMVAATFADGQTLRARRVVLALPPRIAAGLTYDPPLDPETLAEMEAVPTWMAGQAKAMAIYATPFWRDAGLSGDAISRLGPMVEIHDATPAEGGLGALFGFIGVPAKMRVDAGRLRLQVLDQFARLFGLDAAAPLALELKDWAKDRLIATPADANLPASHPLYTLSPAMSDIWDHRLILSGTETAPQFGGYLEGALEAAEHALRQLEPRKR